MREWFKKNPPSGYGTQIDDIQHWQEMQAKAIQQHIDMLEGQSKIGPLADAISRMQRQIDEMRRDTSDFLAWIQWAHPEIRDEYNVCRQIMRKIDEVNRPKVSDDGTAYQAG